MAPDYPDAYYEGMLAHMHGKPDKSCPYQLKASVENSTPEQRQESDMCKRHWWLAGWHEENEKGENHCHYRDHSAS